MKIYQVEELVGITKKNIRFYEEEGLLNPERDPLNGYRDYTLKDVQQLKKIKLLRKLSVPIEDIRLLLKGKRSFEESMEEQIKRLEKEQKNAELMKDFCLRLKNEVQNNLNQNGGDEKSSSKSFFIHLDAEKYLSEISRLEEGGSKFMDVKKEDISRKKKVGAIFAAGFFLALMVLIFASVLIALIHTKTDFMPFIILLVILGCFIIGIVTALILRLKEINKGEEIEALKY